MQTKTKKPKIVVIGVGGSGAAVVNRLTEDIKEPLPFRALAVAESKDSLRCVTHKEVTKVVVKTEYGRSKALDGNPLVAWEKIRKTLKAEKHHRHQRWLFGMGEDTPQFVRNSVVIDFEILKESHEVKVVKPKGYVSSLFHSLFSK